MARKREAVTGYFAKRAISKGRRLVGQVQRDLVALALAAGLGDREALVSEGRGIMQKLQTIDALLQASLDGDYADLNLEDKP